MLASGWYVKVGLALLTLGVVVSALVARNTILLSSAGVPISSEALAGLVRPGEITAVTTVAPFTVTEVVVNVGDHVQAGQSMVRINNTDAQRSLDEVTLELGRAKQEAMARAQGVSRAQQAVAQFETNADASEAVTMAERQLQELPTRQVKDSIERAAAARDQALLTLQRIQRMSEGGLVARQELEQAQLTYRLAVDDFGIASRAAAAAETLRNAQQTDLSLRRNVSRSAAQQQLLSEHVLARQAALVLTQVQARFDEATARLADPFIKAPRAGVVAEIAAHPGDRLAAGAVVVRLATIDPLQIDVDVSPLMANTLSIGAEARVDIRAVSLENATATVRAIAPVPADNGKYIVQLSLPNPGRARLAGLAAEVSFKPVARQ